MEGGKAETSVHLYGGQSKGLRDGGEAEWCARLIGSQERDQHQQHNHCKVLHSPNFKWQES